MQTKNYVVKSPIIKLNNTLNYINPTNIITKIKVQGFNFKKINDYTFDSRYDIPVMDISSENHSQR